MITLINLIAQVESGGFDGAIRFEEEKYQTMMDTPVKTFPQSVGNCLVTIRDIHRCDFLTALQIYCTSYGKFQFMGETLYSDPINLPFPIPVSWSSEIVQASIFQKFVRERSIDIEIDPPRMDDYEQFATVWNGPDDVTGYANRMLTVYKQLKMKD